MMISQQLISTILVDNEPLFRQNMRTLLELYNSESNKLKFSIVGETDSPAKAINLLTKYHPNLMLLDLELEQQNGIEILKYLHTNNLSVKTIILSAHQEEHLIFQAMQAGAQGYIFKTNLVQQLFDAVQTVINDNIYLPPEVATQFFHYFILYSKHLNSHQESDLTRREKEVLQYLIQGFSNEEIAHHLYITVATVKAHLTAIFNKLGVKTRSQAIISALKSNKLVYL